MPPPGTRQPQFPLKTKRMIYSDAEIAQARANVAKFPAARAVEQGVLKIADYWVTWDDAALRNIVPSAAVPRDWWVNEAGCPVHGEAIFTQAGTYPWIVDPKMPFKVKCPIGGEFYPSNDYETYYKSGFKEKQGWETQYVDDGWGWVNPANGQRYWFVAYANHWTLSTYAKGQNVGDGTLNLARAYLLTGDKRYAHKAAVLLQRIAEVYPAMDYTKQSRYGKLMGERGSSYDGKLTYHTWECEMVEELAEAYDIVWETLDGDSELQKATGKNGEQLRAYIEANFLEDAIDAYYQNKIQGNFGMHQSALLHAALARQNGNNAKYFDDILNRNTLNLSYIGLNYALYDLIYRDGIPYEVSPGYNLIWVDKIPLVARLLKKAGYDLFANPRLKRLLDGPLTIVNARQFTPALGDSGDLNAGLVGLRPDIYQPAYRIYKDPRYIGWLTRAGALGDSGYKTFDSLFEAPLAVASGTEQPATLPAQSPRLLDGHGLAILNNPADSISTSLHYGINIGHCHFDSLHFDIFAGKPMTPDLGYPDAMNDYVSGIYTWSKNTISHNTVVVDAKRQAGNVPGQIELFATCPFARVVEADAAGVYPQCSIYRRNLLMIDAGADRSYFVDTFSVVGGTEHDYSLHGPLGPFESIGGQWSAPEKGTLAGEAVPLGQIYDDVKMGAAGYKGGYSTYAGSGFQHLFNVQRLQSGEWIGQYKLAKEPENGLRVHVLPQAGQQAILADAQISPVKFKDTLKYIILRHTAPAGEKNLQSRFLTVLEPYRARPFLRRTEQLVLRKGQGSALQVQYEDGRTDIILTAPTTAEKEIVVGAASLVTDARTAVVTLGTDRSVQRVFFAGGSSLRFGTQRFETPASLGGQVIKVEPEQRRIQIRLEKAPAGFDANALIGRMAHFSNSRRRVTHPIETASIKGDVLTLTTDDDLLIGRAHIKEIGQDAIVTDTALTLGASYRGAGLTDEKFGEATPIEAVASGKIKLAQPLPPGPSLQPDHNAWIVDLSTGDSLEISAVYHWQK